MRSTYQDSLVTPFPRSELTVSLACAPGRARARRAIHRGRSQQKNVTTNQALGAIPPPALAAALASALQQAALTLTPQQAAPPIDPGLALDQ